MNVYETSSIRNVGFSWSRRIRKDYFGRSHFLFYRSNYQNGTVQDGNTISDYDKEEIKRKFSINASVIPVEWNGLKINILDAPGYFDFVGQMEDAMSVADAAVIVVNGKAGIEVGTIKAWEICERRQIPRILFYYQHG